MVNSYGKIRIYVQAFPKNDDVLFLLTLVLLFRSRKRKREGINTNEVKLILSNLDQPCPSKVSTRLEAIVRLLAFQGLRLLEIERLDAQNISLKDGTALFRGKIRHGKEKIYVHLFTIEAVKNS